MAGKSRLKLHLSRPSFIVKQPGPPPPRAATTTTTAAFSVHSVLLLRVCEKPIALFNPTRCERSSHSTPTQTKSNFVPPSPTFCAPLTFEFVSTGRSARVSRFLTLSRNTGADFDAGRPCQCHRISVRADLQLLTSAATLSVTRHRTFHRSDGCS